MALQEKLYTVEDVWQLEQQPLSATEKYYLIDGELIVKMFPSQYHALVASELARLMGNYVAERGLGRVLVECGYHPPNERRTVLLPDVSFESRGSRCRTASRYIRAIHAGILAVEIISPSQTLAQVQRKAGVYLRHGCALVWLIDPLDQYAEVWRLGSDGAPQSQHIDKDGSLTGESVLPGFALELQRLFPR